MIRVIFATEAIGIGVNLPDVRRCGLYGIPRGDKHPAIVWQRGGQASRDGLPGEIIVLVESWACGPRSATVSQRQNSQLSKSQPRAWREASANLDDNQSMQKRDKKTDIEC